MGTKEYDELKRRRDEAAQKAARARDFADELEESAKSLGHLHNVKFEYWKDLVDKLQEAFNSALLEVNRLEKQVEVLTDENQVLIAARSEKGGDLTDIEEQDAKESAKKAAETCRNQIESIQGRINSRHEQIESAKKELDQARDKWNDAKKQATLAAKDAEKLEDDAIGAEETTAKVRCWLRWDGMSNDKGDCNQSHGESKTSKAASTRRNGLPSKEELGKRFDSKLVDEVHSKITGDKVSVRIESCTESFAPIHQMAAVGIELKRSNLINSLLFRVCDKDGTVVYQEILNADHIDKLPRASSRALRHTRSFQERYDSATAVAEPEKASYTFSVWVSTNKDAFANLATVNKPKEISDVQVHDRTARSDGGLLKSGAGINRTDPKKIRMVATAQMIVDTGHGEKVRNERSIKSKVIEIGLALRDAEKAFTRAALADEVRLFLAPEWNFQTDDADNEHLYTEKERDTIVDEFELLSKSGSKWLICPGTILWGMKNKNLGITAAFNTAIFVADGKEVFRYHKKLWGSDISVSLSPFELKASFNEQRHVTLNKGRIPKSIQEALIARGFGNPKSLPLAVVTTLEKDKRWSVTADGDKLIIFEPAHKVKTVVPATFWANRLDDDMWNRCMPTGPKRSDYLLSHYFTHRGLKLAVEICADHRAGLAAIEFPNLLKVGRGTGNDAGVDIHAIASCNVDFILTRLVARTGGYALHCDGSLDLGNAYGVTKRNHSISKVGQEVGRVREANEKEEKLAWVQKRAAKIKRAQDPSKAVEGSLQTSFQGIQKTDYKLHMHRLVLVDP